MARKSRAELLEDDEPGLDISSLIDVCFLLLIYFLVTSTIQKKERDQSTDLPVPGVSAPQVEIEPLLVRVDSQGVVSTQSSGIVEPLDQDVTVRSLPLLDSRISLYSTAASAAGSEKLVQLFVEAEADYQRVIDVLNALAKHDITNVTFTDLLDPDDN